MTGLYSKRSLEKQHRRWLAAGSPGKESDTGQTQKRDSGFWEWMGQVANVTKHHKEISMGQWEPEPVRPEFRYEREDLELER